MKKLLNSLTKIAPWVIGILLSTAGMALGYQLGSDVAGLLGGEPGIWARIGKGFVWGGFIAGLQWPIVRSAGVRPFLFIAVCAVGLAIGYPLGQTIQAIIVQQWSLHLTGYWFAVATFGLFLGLPQWWIFRRHLKRSGLWILFSMTGWILIGLVWISGGRGGFEYGIVTGLGLVWLVRSQKASIGEGVS